VEDAIRIVVERISRRRADKERRDQQAARKYEIEQIVALLPFSMLYSDATPEESAQAKQLVRVALGQVSPTAPSSELYAAKDKALAPIKAAIQLRTEVQRQRESAQRDRERQQRQAQARADSLLSHAVEKRLQKLVDRGTVRFHGDGDRYDLRDKVTRKIRPILVSEIMEAPAISEEQLRERIAHLVDQHHVEFCD
jgi:hypothetical protein